MDGKDLNAHLIRSHGRRMTQQRQTVLDIVNSSQEHLDAEAVYEMAKQEDAKISLATVYRSLALLKEVGLVKENHLGEHHGHFEAAQGDPHFHFTCQSCGQITEFHTPEIIREIQKICERNHLMISEVDLLLRGLCPECVKRESCEAALGNR